jgi:hypothetical protein
VAIQLSDEHTPERNRLVAEADKLAENVDIFKGNNLWQQVRAMYYADCRGDREEALRILKQEYDGGARACTLWAYTALLYHEGESHKAWNILAESPKEGDTPHAISRAGVLAFELRGTDDDFKMLYERATVTNRRDVVWTPDVILLFVDDKKYVIENSGQQLDKLGTDSWHEWDRHVINYCARRVDDAALEEAARGCQRRLCMAHYLIGMRCISDQDWVEARRQFQLCIETEYYGIRWVRAFLECMEKRTAATHSEQP